MKYSHHLYLHFPSSKRERIIVKFKQVKYLFKKEKKRKCNQM